MNKVSEDGKHVVFKAVDNETAPRELLTKLNWETIESLETSAMYYISKTCRLEPNFTFFCMKNLLITTKDPCDTIRHLNNFKFPNLKTFVVQAPIFVCCKPDYNTFIKNFIRDGIYPWLQYCIRKSYPYLDKFLVKHICQYVLLKPIVSPFEKYENVNKKIKTVF
jgi:hypothetical protein